MLLIARQCNNHSWICLVPFLAYLLFLVSQCPLTTYPITELSYGNRTSFYFKHCAWLSWFSSSRTLRTNNQTIPSSFPPSHSWLQNYLIIFLFSLNLVSLQKEAFLWSFLLTFFVSWCQSLALRSFCDILKSKQSQIIWSPTNFATLFFPFSRSLMTILNNIWSQQR